MARFAPVVPPKLAAELLRVDALGDYHLLLAHDVADNPSAYLKIYGKLKDPYIIMDNSVYELGSAVNVSMIKKACDTVNATCVMLPDIIGDCEATIEASMLGAEQWVGTKLPPYMVAPQGQTMDEMIACAKQLMHIEGVKAWGVPKATVAAVGSRQELITRLRNLAPTFDMHLLGFSIDILDDIACARRENVLGIDSTEPIRMGLKDWTISLDNPIDVGSRQESYWEEPDTIKGNPQVLANLEIFRNWIA